MNVTTGVSVDYFASITSWSLSVSQVPTFAVYERLCKERQRLFGRNMICAGVCPDSAYPSYYHPSHSKHRLWKPLHHISERALTITRSHLQTTVPP